MTTTFDELTVDGQLKYANAMEGWAQSVRAAHTWRESRRQDATGANPPLNEAILAELAERLDQGYSDRIVPMPSPNDFLDA